MDSTASRMHSCALRRSCLPFFSGQRQRYLNAQAHQCAVLREQLSALSYPTSMEFKARFAWIFPSPS